ncbi:hypothetical protein PR202_gb10435 [Eleusine coracana subsp. coracana]|uniref:non-specific serine/threonine protein kinase n=1 Tax=Eleusine coracana subsp. coracana TaxID=191504 RepID=A0AAV5EJI9_ELECO|nr:hypothetical protein QOZ80_3BG0255370 [Eleusine coracana subsp. coracana]GJN22835.1 hypothetical protein PR202_gb10435 [Eleusine coracana subsp. coracana]
MAGPSLAKQLVVTVVLLVLAGRTGATEFVFSGFFARENVTTSGAATVTSWGLLQLTNDTNEVFGHGFYPVPVRLKNSTTGAPLSFSTTFVAALVPRYPEAHGHGLAFALAPSAQLPAVLPGKHLGLFNTSDDDSNSTPTRNSSSKVVAVELDTALDAEFGDVDDNHVGVDVHGPRSVNATPAGHVGLTLISGAPMQVWVEYDGPSARLEVTVGLAGAPRPRVPLVSCAVDLASAVGSDEAFVGFSAANGAAASSHYVFGWSFRLGGGGPAPDLDLAKLPTLPSPPPPKKKKTPVLLAVALVLLSLVVVLLVSAAIAATVVRRRRFAEEEEDWEMERYGTHRIRYRDLHVATDGFRHVIGAGGFGTVYRGVLPGPGGEEVAVKKVAHDSRQGLREFVAEVASMSRLRHRSLVHLLGYCRRRGELLLVYDYMVNGSLDKRLFDDPVDQLSWAHRGKVVRDVAAGLLYLHEGWEQVVVHRDVKAANVLLDDAMNARLSDFGLARLHDHGTRPQTTHVVGTIGYIAPEMSKTGKATTATDVYAFGAFLLEVACGRRPLEFSDDNADSLGLVDLVLDHWKKGRIADAKDPRMIVVGKCDEDDIELVLKLGLLCSHPDPRQRPTMRQVTQMMEGAAPVPETAPEDLDHNGRLFYSESFDEFVTMFPTTSQTTTTTTQLSSSYSSDDQRHLISG